MRSPANTQFSRAQSIMAQNSFRLPCTYNTDPEQTESSSKLLEITPPISPKYRLPSRSMSR